MKQLVAIRNGPAARTVGFTLIELLIALALIGGVTVKVFLVVNEGTKALREQPNSMLLDDKAYEVLDRISMAIMGADAESLTPNTQAPLHLSRLKYTISMGVEDGVVIWSDPEEVSLVAAPDTSQVLWRRNPDQPEEIRVVWARFVDSLLEGEVGNGLDDNLNGLVDEEGLTFVVDGEVVTIRLSLRRTNPEGEPWIKTVETTVTCRNSSE